MSLDPAERDPFQLNLDFQHVPVQIACHPEWKLQLACRMHKPEHITLLEGRGTVQAVRHKMRVEGNYGMKHLHLGDNLGMVLAFDRGRAKAVPLLICCRRATAFAIAGDCVFTHRWIPSEHNAADAGSRQWEQEKPSEAAAKSRSKEAVTSLCYPKSKSCFSKEQGRELLWGCARRVEEVGPAQGACGSSHQAQSAQSAPRAGRSHPGFQTPGSGGSGQAAQPERGAHLPRDRGGGAEDQRGVPPQVEPVRVLLQNPEVEAAKRGRSGLRLEPVSEPSFLGRMGHQRGCQMHGCSHRPLARLVRSRTAPANKKVHARMAEPRPRCHTAASGVATGRPDRPDCPSGGPVCSVHGHPLHVRHLRAAGRGLRDPAPGSGEKQVARAGLVCQSPPVGRPPGVEGGGKQRDHPAGQQGNPVARSSARVHDSHIRSSVVSHELHRAARHMASCSQTTRTGVQVCSASPVETLWGELGPLQELPQFVGGQTSRALGGRQQLKAVRTTCNGSSAVREVGPGAQTTSASCPSYTASNGPRQMWPQTVKVSKPFLELFSGCAHLSQACASLGIPCEAWDIDYGEACNVLTPKVAAVLLHHIAKGEFSAVHLGMPCITWSRARRDDGRGPRALRDDHAGLFGLPSLMPWERRKVQEGNQLLEFSLQVIACCQKLGLPWSLENPLTSRVWLVPAMQRLQTQGATFVNTCYCMYGMPWRKATAFLCGNFNLSLRTCEGSFRCCERSGKAHVHVVGRDNGAGLPDWHSLTPTSSAVTTHFSCYFALSILRGRIWTKNIEKMFASPWGSSLSVRACQHASWGSRIVYVLGSSLRQRCLLSTASSQAHFSDLVPSLGIEKGMLASGRCTGPRHMVSTKFESVSLSAGRCRTLHILSHLLLANHVPATTHRTKNIEKMFASPWGSSLSVRACQHASWGSRIVYVLGSSLRQRCLLSTASSQAHFSDLVPSLGIEKGMLASGRCTGPRHRVKG